MWISFWLYMSNVIINVLQEEEEKKKGGYWLLDVGIFPLCRLPYPLPEVLAVSATNGDPSRFLS